MAKYGLVYRNGDKLEKINLNKVRDLSIKEIEEIETELNINLDKLKSYKKNYIKRGLIELKKANIDIYDRVKDLNVDSIEKMLIDLKINLNKLNYTKEFEIDTLENIDLFTTTFNNLDDMLKFLKRISLIDESVDRIFVSQKKELELYKYPNKIFYKNEEAILSISYIKKLLNEKMIDGEFISKIAFYYMKKHSSKMDPLNGVCYSIYDISSSLNNENSYSYLPYHERIEYIENIETFIKRQFYKKDKMDKYIPDYKNIREFFCFILGEKKFIPLDKKDEIKHQEEKTCNYVEEEIEEEFEEEFLEPEDFKVYYDLIQNIKNDEWEAYRDGHDYIKPIDKKEIRSAYKDIARDLISKKL